MLLLLALLVQEAHATDVLVGVAEVPGSARMVGMGGAYRAIAEGAAAQRLNPAALAVRPTDTNRAELDFDYVANADGLVPVLIRLDLAEVVDAPLPTLGVTLGGMVQQHGHAGAALFDLATQYDAESGRGTALIEVSAGYGASILGDRLQLGFIPTLQIVRAGGQREPLLAVMPTLGVGARWDVVDSPVRLGASLRTPWRTRVDDPLVDGIRLPWEAGIGLALRRGRMHRGARPEVRPDAPMYVQFAVDISAVGPARDVTSMEAWTRGADSSGDVPTTLSIATGLELEPAPWFFRVRTGLYTEPARARFSLDDVRLHGTLGFDLALFEFPRSEWRWMVSPVVDASSLGIRPMVELGLW